MVAGTRHEQSGHNRDTRTLHNYRQIVWDENPNCLILHNLYLTNNLFWVTIHIELNRNQTQKQIGHVMFRTNAFISHFYAMSPLGSVAVGNGTAIFDAVSGFMING